MIVWLRRDLRLADQPAFTAAASRGPVIPVFVLDDERAGDRKLGGASRWWLHHSLEALATDLHRHNSRLILRRGDCVEQLCRISEEAGAWEVHALRHYEPWWREAEQALGKELDLALHDGNYLLPPGSLKTGSGSPYRIYTPFAKAARRELPQRDPLPEPSLTLPGSWPQSDDLASWSLRPTRPDWAEGLRANWKAGTGAAQEKLSDFIDRAAAYSEQRNLPAVDGTSRLSPHLHWGEISPGQVWHALEGKRGSGADTFRGELLWRDYAQNVICQFPDYPEESYRDGYGADFWRNPNRGHLIEGDVKAWQKGRTGYPIVDAGMRQLWHTGWMHNRVRMIAASFLVKHLLIDWRFGERWFWDTLVDADYASNGVNWQWVAGTGVDANMFVRIMAPLSQSEKFDAEGYIRQWVPELAELDDGAIHDPPPLLRPSDYPDKLISHREGRARALEAYEAMKLAVQA